MNFYLIYLYDKGVVSMDKEKLKQNPKLRRQLRILGFILTFIGGLLTVISFIDFLSSYNNFNKPSLFWLSFLSFPCLAIGLFCLYYGYMGAVKRYTSSEIAPVAKDTINYLLDGTKESLSDVAREIKSNEKVLVCQICQERNNGNAKFCQKCGSKLTKTCPTCHVDNDQKANYCINCGGKLNE